MDATKVAEALPDGATVTIQCEIDAAPVFNGYQSVSLWARLTDGTWLPDAFLDTGTLGRTPGVPDCSELQFEQSQQSQSVTQGPIHYEGVLVKPSAGPLPLTYALWDHYLWGGGQAVVLDATDLNSNRAFVDHVRSLPLGGFDSWKPPTDSDLFWAIGTFTVSRESATCWAIYDHYDFTPDKPSNAPYIPYWAYQLGGARDFDVHSSGCLS